MLHFDSGKTVQIMYRERLYVYPIKWLSSHISTRSFLLEMILRTEAGLNFIEK